MRKTQVLIAFLSLLHIYSAVGAELGRALLINLDWLNGKLKFPAQCLEEENFYYGYSSALEELCASQLCGTASENESPKEHTRRLYFDPSFTNRINDKMTEVEGLLLEYASLVDQDRRLVLEAYDDIKSKNQLTPSPIFRRMHDLNMLLRESDNVIRRPTSDFRYPIKIDEVATENSLSYLPKEQSRWVIEGWRRMTQSELGGDLWLGAITDPKRYFALKHPDRPIDEAVRNEARRILSIAERFKSNEIGQQLRLINSIDTVLNDPLIARAANGESLSEVELTFFMRSRMFILLIDDAYRNPAQGGSQIVPNRPAPETTREYLKRVNFDKAVEDYKKRLAQAEDLEYMRSNIHGVCLSNYLNFMATAPTAEQIQKFNEKAGQVKERVFNALSSQISRVTSQILREAFDKASFATPRTFEDYHSYYVENLRSRIANRKRSVNQYRELIAQGKHQPVTLLAVELDSERFNLDEHYFDFSEFCDDHNFRDLSDRILTPAGAIHVSAYSVHNPELGVGGIMHELGHLAFSHLESSRASQESRQKFAAARECLAENHPETEAQPGQFYVNEDWADLIAGMAGEDKFVCSLFDQLNDQYVGLIPINLDPRFRHSTPLFRSLHVRKVRGLSLPSSCQQMMESVQPGWTIRKCL